MSRIIRQEITILPVAPLKKIPSNAKILIGNPKDNENFPHNMNQIPYICMENPTIVTVEIKATLKISLAPTADIEEVLTNMDYNFVADESYGGTVVDTEITDWNRTDEDENDEDENDEDELAQDFLQNKEILP